MDNNATEAPPTSSATSQKTEPEIVAGISSGEGQPSTYDYAPERQALAVLPALLALGAAALGVGMGRWINRAR